MRKPQVTRTIETTVCTVLKVNVSTQETSTAELVLNRSHKDDSKLLGLLKANYDTRDEKIVHVIGVTYKKRKYAMDEADFIANAEIVGFEGEDQE